MAVAVEKRMKPEDINKLAEKEKSRDKKSRRWGKEISVVKPRFRPASPESWRVYTRIYPYYYNVFVWFFLVFTVGFVCFFLYYLQVKDDRLWYGGLIATGIWLIRVGIHWGIKIVRFSTYKNWRRSIPFQIKGWEILGSKENFPSHTYWDDRVEVRVNSKITFTPEEKKAIQNALYLLTKKANKCFYDTEGLFDGRKKWIQPDELIASGSANAAVMGEIYLFLNVYLRGIQNAYGNIASVEISCSGKLSEVERVSVSSE